MKWNDEAVLEPLHLQPADLSSGRRFMKETAGEPPEPQAMGLTRSVLEVRGILSRPAPPPECEAGGQRMGPGSADVRGLNRQGLAPEVKPSVVWVPVLPLSRESFQVLQKFEGRVLSLTADSFVARLLDRTKPGPEEEAEIPLAEVMPGDHQLVKPGAVFYWVIGYRREAHGQLSRSSVIRFQRVPSWSAADVDRAKKEAETFLSFLDLDRANNPA
jgi:hypothetical protein